MSEDEKSQEPESAEKPPTAVSEASAPSSQSFSHHTRADQTIQGEPPEASPAFNRLYDQLNFLLEQKETLMINNIGVEKFNDYYKMWRADVSCTFRRLVILHKRRHRPNGAKTG